MQETEYDAIRNQRLLNERRITRRDILKLGAGLPVALGIARLATPTSVARAASRERLADREEAPCPSGSSTSAPTPRCAGTRSPGSATRHRTSASSFATTPATPIIDPATWSLRVFGTGLKGSPVSFTYAQLQALPQKEIVSFIECAGNGRSFFGSQQGTPASGTQWGLGAIGVARWRGVPLSEILDRAGIAADAVDVMPYGLDSNVVTGGIDYGHVRRPIPVAKALDNALVALEMNGQPLPADHGFPARLIVPGWIGVANIKWIGQIEVSRQPLFSLWNTQQYVMTGPSYPTTPLLTTQVVKSAWELARGATFAPARRSSSTAGPGPARPGSTASTSASTAASPGPPRSCSTAAARATGRGSPIRCPPSRPATTSSGRAPPTTTLASNPRSPLQQRRLPVRRHRPPPNHHALTTVAAS